MGSSYSQVNLAYLHANARFIQFISVGRQQKYQTYMKANSPVHGFFGRVMDEKLGQTLRGSHSCTGPRAAMGKRKAGETLFKYSNVNNNAKVNVCVRWNPAIQCAYGSWFI